MSLRRTKSAISLSTCAFHSYRLAPECAIFESILLFQGENFTRNCDWVGKLQFNSMSKNRNQLSVEVTYLIKLSLTRSNKISHFRVISGLLTPTCNSNQKAFMSSEIRQLENSECNNTYQTQLFFNSL